MLGEMTGAAGRKTDKSGYGQSRYEEKVTLGGCSVHSPFTPAGLILMAYIVQFTCGGQRAPARR
jgi:hypothetical protein